MLRNRLLAPGVLFFSLAAFLVGCSNSTVPVSGTVTYKGEKVKGGSISFAPVGKEGNSANRTGEGMVDQDGAYTANGVALGKNRVTYHPPGGGDPNTPVALKPGEAIPESPYKGLVPETAEVDIQSKTSVNVTLKKAG